MSGKHKTQQLSPGDRCYEQADHGSRCECRVSREPVPPNHARSHCRRSVEPGNGVSRLGGRHGRPGSPVMLAMEWKVPLNER